MKATLQSMTAAGQNSVFVSQGCYDRRERILQRSTSQGSIGSPVYNRHGYTPTLLRSPQHFHRPGELLEWNVLFCFLLIPCCLKTSPLFWESLRKLTLGLLWSHFCSNLKVNLAFLLYVFIFWLISIKSLLLMSSRFSCFFKFILNIPHFMSPLSVFINSCFSPFFCHFAPYLPPILSTSVAWSWGVWPPIPPSLQRLWQACRSSAPPFAVTVWAPEIVTPAPHPLSDTTSSLIAKVRAPIQSYLPQTVRQTPSP